MKDTVNHGLCTLAVGHVVIIFLFKADVAGKKLLKSKMSDMRSLTDTSLSITK